MAAGAVPLHQDRSQLAAVAAASAAVAALALRHQWPCPAAAVAAARAQVHQAAPVALRLQERQAVVDRGAAAGRADQSASCHLFHEEAAAETERPGIPDRTTTPMASLQWRLKKTLTSDPIWPTCKDASSAPGSRPEEPSHAGLWSSSRFTAAASFPICA